MSGVPLDTEGPRGVTPARPSSRCEWTRRPTLGFARLPTLLPSFYTTGLYIPSLPGTPLLRETYLVPSGMEKPTKLLCYVLLLGYELLFLLTVRSEGGNKRRRTADPFFRFVSRVPLASLHNPETTHPNRGPLTSPSRPPSPVAPHPRSVVTPAYLFVSGGMTIAKERVPTFIFTDLNQ